MLIDWGVPFTFYKFFLQKKYINSEGKFIGPFEMKRLLLILLIVNFSFKNELIFDKLYHFIAYLDSEYLDDDIYFSSFPVFKVKLNNNNNNLLLFNQLFKVGRNRLIEEISRDIIFNKNEQKIKKFSINK